MTIEEVTEHIEAFSNMVHDPCCTEHKQMATKWLEYYLTLLEAQTVGELAWLK